LYNFILGRCIRTIHFSWRRQLG